MNKREELKPHLNKRLGFTGFVSRKSTGGHVLIVQVETPNDPRVLVNHLWITVPKSIFLKLEVDDQIKFSGLVIKYSKQDKGLGNYGRKVGDYGVASVRNIEVVQMANTIGKTVPYVAPIKPRIKEPVMPVAVEKPASKPLKQILIEKNVSGASLSAQLGKSTNYISASLSKQSISTKTKIQISEILNVPLLQIDFDKERNAAIEFPKGFGLKRPSSRQEIKVAEESAIEVPKPSETNTESLSTNQDDKLSEDIKDFMEFKAFQAVKRQFEKG